MGKKDKPPKQKRHKWAKRLTKLFDSTHCLDCGVIKDKNGHFGTWYYNPKTEEKGYEYQPCKPITTD